MPSSDANTPGGDEDTTDGDEDTTDGDEDTTPQPYETCLDTMPGPHCAEVETDEDISPFGLAVGQQSSDDGERLFFELVVAVSELPNAPTSPARNMWYAILLRLGDIEVNGETVVDAYWDCGVSSGGGAPDPNNAACTLRNGFFSPVPEVESLQVDYGYDTRERVETVSESMVQTLALPIDMTSIAFQAEEVVVIAAEYEMDDGTMNQESKLEIGTGIRMNF